MVPACSSETADTPSVTSAGASGSTSTTSTAGPTGTSGSGGTDGAGGTGGTDTIGGSGGSASGAPDAASNDRPDAQTPAQDGGATKPTDPSAGCGKAAGQQLATYVQKTLGTTKRVYQLYIPDGYDSMRAYTTVFLGHGCTDNGAPFPIEKESKTDAIVIAMKSAGACFDYAQEGPDVMYFDQLLAEVSANYCVNKKRVFVAGFSSGSWMSHTLGCDRAGIIRGQGNASGNQRNLMNCKGPIAAMFSHDINDTTNTYAKAQIARDRILKQNGCSMTETDPYDYDGDPATPSPCVQYRNCMPGYPVVWCPTKANGNAHNNQVPISTVGFWRFWSNL